MTSPDEDFDLEEMKREMGRIRINAFSAAKYLLRATPEELKAAGHKTAEDGVVYTITEAMKQIDALDKAHFKKWPD